MLGNKTKGKSLYVTPEMDIMEFTDDDVITTSGDDCYSVCPFDNCPSEYETEED